jgi:hypothetical protein
METPMKDRAKAVRTALEDKAEVIFVETEIK